MKTIEPSGCYAAHWGLTDLYDEDEANLRAALESGEDFEFDYGCKKEIHYANIKRENGVLTVECRACIDDLPDLLDTAFWNAFGGNANAGSGWEAVAKAHDRSTDDDEFIQGVFDQFEQEILDSEIYDETFRVSEVVEDQSFDSVMATVDNLEDMAADAGEKCYDNIVEYLKEAWACSQETPDMRL